MLESVKEFNLAKIIEIVIRRRWFIIIPFCLSMLSGIYFAVTLPRVYGSETLILVEPQKVPTNYVKPIVSAEADNRISTISQQIMSRSNLEKIIDEFKLYSDPGQENMFLEDKIEYMRNRISVKLIRKRGSEAFSISFKGKSPEIVMNVTNTLSTKFINQNLKVREAQGVTTSTFLEKQMNAKREELEKIEESLRQYRQRYMGELPEQLETNLRALDRIQRQIYERQQAIRDIRKQLVLLDNQQEIYRNMLKENQSTPNETSVSNNGSYETINLDDDVSEVLIQLKEELKKLKLRYTDSHPDVANIKRLIVKIEAEKEFEKVNEKLNSNVTLADTEKKNKDSDSTLISKKSEETNKILDSTEIEKKSERIDKEMSEVSRIDIQNNQKDELYRDIDQLKAEIYKLNEEMKIYQKRVENTPKREQELLSLNRDYDNINDAYNSLLRRKIEAEIAVNMEKHHEGERFRILDYAQLPEKPISPNMIALFLLAVTGGLSSGCGLTFLIETFNKSFRSPEEIEALTGIRVAITLPLIYHPKDLVKQKVNKFLSLLFITISCVLFLGFAVLTFKGVEQTMVVVERFIAR